MTALRCHEKWMNPVLMALFAFGGTSYGKAEETLAFYPLPLPIMIAAFAAAIARRASFCVVRP